MQKIHLSVANRYIDNLIIEMGCAAFEVHDHNLPDEIEDGLNLADMEEIKVSDKGSTRYKLKFQSAPGNETGFICVQKWDLPKKVKAKGKIYPKPGVVNKIGRLVNAVSLHHGECIVVKGFTEHNCDNVKFRTHPNYQQEGPWNDWIYIQWEEHGSLPAKLEAFFYYGGTAYAVIHSVAYTPEQYSVLTRHSQLEYRGDPNHPEPNYIVVECSCFRHHTFIYPKSFKHNEKGVFELLPYEMWGSKFTYMGNNELDDFYADIYEEQT